MWEGHHRVESNRGIENQVRSIPSKACRWLNTFKKEARYPLQEHVAEVQRIVGLAYSELAVEYQRRIALDIFSSSSLGNAAL